MAKNYRRLANDFSNESIEKTILENISAFDKENRYDETVLFSVFKVYDNSTVENVLTKVVLLNKLYSAGLNDHRSDRIEVIGKRKKTIDVYTMSEFLYGYNEKRISTGTCAIDCCSSLKDVIDVIKEICSETSKLYNIPLSFLSKYFSWTYQVKNKNIEVPIVDSYVRGMLYRLCKEM